MLRRCNLTITEQEIALADVAALVARETGGMDDAPAFLETLDNVVLTTVKKIDVAGVTEDLRRLVIFSSDRELRIEYAEPGRLFVRLLAESSGDDYVYREDQMLLRPGSADGAGRQGRVLSREYYQQDSDGLYVFRADRLAGLAS